MNIIGHSTIIDILMNAAQSGQASHAYCFVGPQHIGKETVALHLAGQLLGISPEKVAVCADALIIGRLQDEKTEKTKKDISIEQIKEVSSFMSQSALKHHGHKVVIIREAERMSMGASNALLKTLEEPTAHSHLFLLTTDDAMLLPTIRSRCHTFRFAPVATSQISAYLQEQGAAPADAEEIARVSRGLPGLAISWYHMNDEFIRYKEGVYQFVQLFGKPFHQKLVSVEDLFGDKTDAVGTRDDIKEILGVWRLVLRDIWLIRQGKQDEAVHLLGDVPVLQSDQIIAIDQRIVHASRLIDRNIHPRLLIEQILLRIP